MANHIPELQDISTPYGMPLRGIYRRSFAFVTIKERLPVILTKIIDTLSRNKNTIVQIYGLGSSDEIKQIMHSISELKNEIMTNKPLKMLPLLTDMCNEDTIVWNEFFKKRIEIEKGPPMWFNTLWLYCECYMYRRLAQLFLLTNNLKQYDYFAEIKQTSLVKSMNSVKILANYTMNLVTNMNMTVFDKKDELTKLIKVCLWGNRCDLSLSAGSESNQTDDPIQILNTLNNYIIVNDSSHLWEILNKQAAKIDTVDIVLDNAGYELFTDLCLAVFLVAQGLTKQVRFYAKQYPWYVSDVNAMDFHWTIDYIKNYTYPQLRELGELAYQYLSSGKWVLYQDNYWTGPYCYMDMNRVDPALYAKLSEAKLIIFKGDLHYRKLLSDINWEPTTWFRRTLMDFQPTNVLSLRTIKSDICVGLPAGLAEALFSIDKDWMLTGQYGLIQLNLDVRPSTSH